MGEPHLADARHEGVDHILEGRPRWRVDHRESVRCPDGFTVAALIEGEGRNAQGLQVGSEGCPAVASGGILVGEHRQRIPAAEFGGGVRECSPKDESVCRRQRHGKGREIREHV